MTRPNTFYLTGGAGASNQTYGDALPSDNWIQTFYGFQFTPSAVMPASTVLRLTMSVFGSVGALAANLVAPSAVTSITLAAPGLTRYPGAAGGPSLPSGSVITLTATDGTSANVTLSAAAVLGQTVLAINSFTSAKTFNAGVPISWQIGNGPAFGWRSTVDGDAGTPVFPANLAAVSPAISANTSLAGAGTNLALALQLGDALFMNIKTDAGTVVIPISNIQPLLV